MTDDTEDTNNNNNVKQLSLHLVPPSDKGTDEELKDCLNQGLAVFIEQMKNEEVQSFFAIILDESDTCTFIGAGQAQTLKTLGALRSAEDELLKGV